MIYSFKNILTSSFLTLFISFMGIDYFTSSSLYADSKDKDILTSVKSKNPFAKSSQSKDKNQEIGSPSTSKENSKKKRTIRWIWNLFSSSTPSCFSMER
jgi:hypothetical protein